MYDKIKVPAVGQKITVNPDFSLNVPDTPIIPYIEGDGTGVDISPVMIRVVDAAVAKAGAAALWDEPAAVGASAVFDLVSGAFLESVAAEARFGV